MTDECIVVFTYEDPSRILQQGGSRAWELGKTADHARKCPYLICTQNQDPKLSNLGASEPHGAVFLVGKISGVIPDSIRGDRWQICISEYALHLLSRYLLRRLVDFLAHPLLEKAHLGLSQLTRVQG
jgi:hypothetical protein